MEIALFKDLGSDTQPRIYDIDYMAWVLTDPGYVQLSEIIDVDFREIKDADIVSKQVDFIDNKIKQVQAVSEAKINELTQQRNELLAIPHIKAV